MRTRPLLVAGIVMVFAAGCTDDESLTAPSTPIQPQYNATAVPVAEDRTPFQRSLMQTIAERQAAGLPVPVRVAYEYDAGAPAPGLAARVPGAAGVEQTVTARTVLEFTSPDQAGLAEWPAVVVSGAVPAEGTGFIREGDYTQFIKDEIARQHPNSNTDYESGPRTYTFDEILVLGPGESAAGARMNVELESLADVTVADELLLGFTVLGPNIDYSLAFDVSICVFWLFGCHAEVDLVDFWAGYKMDWTIGMRLPMDVEVTAAGGAKEGATFPVSSRAIGRDWSASRFELAGVSPEDGNEFLLQFVFKVGVFVEVLGVDVVDLGVDIDLDKVASFATPLGPGATFSIPAIDLEIWGVDYGVVAGGVGVALTPRMGSDRLTAGWNVTGQGSGSGSVTYGLSGADVPLGSVTAIDGPGNATLQVSGVQYHFTNFGLDLGVYFDLYVLGYGGRWDIPITGFSLGGVTGGLYLTPHAGTPGTLALAIPIENVAPVVTLSHAGAIPVNGVNTFFTGPGQPLSFTGVAYDPGRDDLTLAWDWDDGAPAPDESALYTLPTEVTESRTHQFDGACLYQVKLTATDDDDATGQDVVPVVALGSAANRARPEGYWQHQLARTGNTDFSDAELECLLAVVAHMSTVFSEQRDVSTLPAAHDVLFLAGNAGSEQEQLDRELLVAWLNYANGALATRAGMFMQHIAAAERMRLDPLATPANTRRTTQTVHLLGAGSD